MLAIAVLFAFGVHRSLHAVIPRSTDLPADAVGRLRVSASRLLVDLAALGAFGLGGWLSLQWLLPAPDMAHALGVHLIRYGSTAALFWIGGRFLLAPRDPENRLLPLPKRSLAFPHADDLRRAWRRPRVRGLSRTSGGGRSGGDRGLVPARRNDHHGL